MLAGPVQAFVPPSPMPGRAPASRGARLIGSDMPTSHFILPLAALGWNCDHS